MSDEATSRPPPHSVLTSLPSVPIGGSSDSDGNSSNSSLDMDDLVLDSLIDDPMEERMEDLVVAELLRGATPEQRRQMEAQRDECRAKQKELQLQVSRDRAQMRSLKKYTDLIGVDVSGYTDAQKEQYESQLERLSREIFGKDR